jgi:hypothetical protein
MVKLECIQVAISEVGVAAMPTTMQSAADLHPGKGLRAL